ncbi:hypothetical protein BGZ93_009948 [Podila epicladia]|nr:hypothetical protein BGZ92_001770 [Podila epicladia]KAG0089246.1 hypothetical protein BGZ93_009948 [Podila epicladia]
MVMKKSQAQVSGSTTPIERTAVRYPEIAKLISYLQSPETIETEGEGRCLFFQALIAAAYTLWLTFEEVTQLQGKHIKFPVSSSEGSPYFTVSMPFRTSNSLNPLQENVYEIYLQPDEPDACLVTKLLDWIQWADQHNITPLGDDDFVFPDIFSDNDDDDDEILMDKRCSVTQLASLMEKYARDTGLIEHGSCLSTDCLRRGGAQHRLMHVQNRWLFKAVKWWGGWTDKDSAESVFEYILADSSRTSFGDMMSPQRTQQAGRDNIWQTMDALVMSDRLKAAIQAMETSSKAVAKLEKVSQQSNRKIDQGFKDLRREWAEVKDTISRAVLSLASGADHSQDTNDSLAQRPDFPKIVHWKEAIRQWDEGDPKRGLAVPLCKWPRVWRKNNLSFYNRSLIVQEFEHFGRDESKMRSEYGDLLSGRVMDLIVAIRDRRRERKMQQRGVSPTRYIRPGRKPKRKLEEVEIGEDEDEKEETGNDEDGEEEESDGSEENVDVEHDTADEEGSEGPLGK